MPAHGEKISLDGLSLTIREWAQMVGVSEGALRGRLNNGLAPSEAFRSKYQLGNSIQRIYFKGESMTIKEWSEKLGLKAEVIRARFKSGMPTEQVLHVGRLNKSTNKKEVPVVERPRGRKARLITNGSESLTIRQWAKKLGVTYATIHRRLREFGPEKALSMETKRRGRVRLITHGGETLRLCEWAEKIGVNVQTLARRLQVWPLEKALSPRLFRRGRKMKFVTVPDELAFEGRTMSLAAWAEEVGISVESLVKRIRRGYPIGRVLKPDGRGRNGSVLLTKDGKTQNLTDWSKELGISLSALSRRLSRNPGKGWDFPKSHRSEYADLPEFRKWKFINGKAVKVGKGWTFDEFMEEVGIMPDPKAVIARKDASKPWGPGNVEWVFQSNSERTSPSARIIKFRGKEMSMRSWCKELGIGETAVSQRISKLGWPIERALTTPLIPSTLRSARMIEWNGQSMSIKAWASKIGIPYGTLIQRLRNLSVEEAFSKPHSPVVKPRFLTYQGKTMRIGEWERVLGVSKGCIGARIRSGWSVEEALSTPGKGR